MRKRAGFKRAGTFITALLLGTSISLSSVMASSDTVTITDPASSVISESNVSESTGSDVEQSDSTAEITAASTVSGAESNAESSTTSSDTGAATASTANSKNGVGITNANETGSKMMYRLYNPNSGEHFYTSSEKERDVDRSYGWKYEGIGWYAPETSDVPVYRLYNPNAGDHHYTVSTAERDNLVNVGWKYEGIGWYSASSDKVPIYRLYNPNASGAGAHHYTSSASERESLIAGGWNDENIGWYAVKATEHVSTVTGITYYNGKDYSMVYNFEYYINKYPDIKAAFGNDDSAAIEHFITTGLYEGRQASENFSIKSYRYAYPDLRAQFHNDLMKYVDHYINNGYKEGRTATGVDSMQNIVTTYNGVDYSLVYNYDYYKTNHQDVVKALGGDDDYALLEYFVTKGINLEQQASANFNEKAYRHNNADLRKAFGSDKAAYYKHYIEYGHNERRDALNDSDRWIGDNWQKTYNGVDLSSVYDYYYYRNNHPEIVSELTDNDDLLIKYFATTGIKKGQVAKSGVSASSSTYKNVLYKLYPELQDSESQIVYNMSSDTKYCILVNRTKHMVYVFQGSRHNWTKILSSPCVVGKPSTPTYTGTFKTRRGGKYFNTGGYRCFYYTPFNGSIYFHSTIYTQTEEPTREVDGTMSASVSHGCVRLPLKNAYWIYTNIGLNAIGTTVYVYDS